MNTKRSITILLPVLIVLLAISVGLVAAQESQPGAERQPLAPDAPEAHSNFIPLQGRLTDASGNPLDGIHDVVFRLYGHYEVGSPLCESWQSLRVQNGLFNAYMNGTGCKIDGRLLYLGVQVEDDPEMTPRLFVDNVPYAWSLRPGAVISDNISGSSILHIENWGDGGRGLRSYAMAESGANYGVVGASRSPNGYGGYFYNNGGGVGLFGQSDAASSAGVRAEGVDSGADLVLGGNANTGAGDDGILASDPAYASSDIIIKTNDTLRVDLDDDNDGEDADFEIYGGANTLIFNVDESGVVTHGGAGIAAFPRPAYDSGWLPLNLSEDRTLTHSLGGNTDNYVVDLTCRMTGGSGVNNWGLGGDANYPDYYGSWWSNLTSTQITLHRWDDDTDCPQLRVRIWMYP